MFMLNKGIIIQVKTGVGMSDQEETDEYVSQGTNDGSLVSASNISKGVKEIFRDSEDEISLVWNLFSLLSTLMICLEYA